MIFPTFYKVIFPTLKLAYLTIGDISFTALLAGKPLNSRNIKPGYFLHKVN